MGALRLLVRLLRTAPSKRRFLRSLPLGSKRGDRLVISADGTRLSARRSGEGPPVVIVHGTLDGIGAFAAVELELAERYTVWVYDRRGRGGSADDDPLGDDYSLVREVEDLQAVLEATGAPAHVVAHSFGAVVALRARLAGTDMRSLVVYEPPLNTDAITDEHISAIRDALDADRPDDAIRLMAVSLAGLTDDEVEIGMSVPPERKRLREGTRTVVREIEAIRSCRWDDLPVDGVPTLVLCGERRGSEAYPTADQAAALADDATVATLPGQGHLAHVFTPWTFTREVRSFLDVH